ncbi:MAG TPA: Stk1 family PASTA domain-containing Ser/Thr kinase [Solirubrobacteraceae bacterium]|nr:Stk1 family PASTA domain-containing Ser/Thr kinase [Solirubrobacteraceae bacterium]
MIEPDTIIDGRYRVISRLGSGGMADVYLAQDQLLGRHLAVKVLHHHFAEDQEFVERFKREASSAAALSHPNIVGIFDRGEWNGTYYIAMEYVAGRSLKSIIREDGALDPLTAIDIVVQILRAARFAHRRGVIHRDLKPHNVILDEEGRARVTDFGIARAGASDMTLTGSVMGTAQYLSPEQAQGFAVSSASDLYSVGVILYELLTGVVPFEGESAVAIAYKQVSAAPRPPSELNPAIPPSLDAVVMRALAKDPAQRYADADELIVALEHEREVLRTYQGAAIPASHPSGAIALAEAPPATGSMLVVPPLGPPAEEEPPQEDHGRRWWLWAVVATAIVVAVALALVLTQGKKQVTVPRVVGETERAAIIALHRVGLQANPTLAPSVRVQTGLVVTQSPPAGSDARKGSTVKIVVSGGPANVPLPDVHGLHATQASARLHAAGFVPVVRNTPNSTVPAGIVIGTEPPAGTVDRQGSAVNVLVSTGPALITVPDLTGESLSSAQTAIANAGLANGTVTRQPSSSQSAGNVLSQEPKAGSEVRSDAKVNLVVAEAPKAKQVGVPTVVGRTELSAEEALERAGLAPQVSSVVTGEASSVGKVLRQSPSGGTHVAKGSTVRIFVGVGGGTSTTPTTTTPTTTTPTTPGQNSPPTP